ncbi:hypothetical protein L484_019504 [Morus notabilis]|uniref:Uncharacterized protein n=1 Tax=Morus notabilis TaxID=981085 RepID=W9R3M9_9ROSA|nr:hypothetical protein L484_019504 [Morus notabilis]
MGAGPKSPADPEMHGEFNGLLTEQDDAVLELSPEIPINEEEVEEYEQELYRELHSAALTDVTSFPPATSRARPPGRLSPPRRRSLWRELRSPGAMWGPGVGIGGVRWRVGTTFSMMMIRRDLGWE